MGKKEIARIEHNKTVVKNTVEAVKKRIFLIESELTFQQDKVIKLMKQRDEEQKFLLDIFERGIDALTGTEPKQAKGES